MPTIELDHKGALFDHSTVMLGECYSIHDHFLINAAFA